MNDPTLEEMKPLLRPLFAGLMMLGELITDGVPGEACDALITAAAQAGRSPEAQMAFNAVQCADALLFELELPPSTSPTRYQSREEEFFPRFEALVRAIKETAEPIKAPGRTDGEINRVAALLMDDYDDYIPF